MNTQENDELIMVGGDSIRQSEIEEEPEAETIMYKITIEQTTQEKKMTGKDWKIVSKTGEDHKYDYTPEIEKVVDVERTVYTQIVRELNLVAVINAVNGIIGISRA